MKIFLKDTINNLLISNLEHELEFVINAFTSLSNHRDSEIKIYGENNIFYLLKISPLCPQEFKIDVPVKNNSIHKQCYVTKEQCIAIIKELFDKGNIDNVPGFIEVPIREFTLDDMLEFKKEEEMMLKGQDPFTKPNEQEVKTKLQEKVIKKEDSIPIKKTAKPYPNQLEKKKNIKASTIKKDKPDSYFQI